MRLYLIHRCPFGHRVAFALKEKRIEHEIIFFDRRNRPPELEAVGPYAKSPTLFDGEARIYDSAVVLEYLEDQRREPALLPPDARGRAEVRSFIARINDELMPGLGTIAAEALKPTPDPARVADAYARFVETLGVWDQRLEGRRFAVGNSLSLADITLYTPFVAIQGFTQSQLPRDRFPRLCAWLDQTANRGTSRLPEPDRASPL